MTTTKKTTNKTTTKRTQKTSAKARPVARTRTSRSKQSATKASKKQRATTRENASSKSGDVLKPFDFDFTRPFDGDFDALCRQRNALYAKLSRQRKSGNVDYVTQFHFNEIDEYVEFVKQQREQMANNVIASSSKCETFKRLYNERIARDTNTTCRVVNGQYVIDGIIIHQSPFAWKHAYTTRVEPLMRRVGVTSHGRSSNNLYIVVCDDVSCDESKSNVKQRRVAKKTKRA